ncbi:unnamed protein product [Phytophthora fragariaefolia]|uniref:Unnamed protein product n=1 Tax=Phytophthora fragariaefolia TaxID=1490495 RepID=A0A9W6XQZ1_9STRA|nr:unnamed protein product [Phytophthora fragariaefolia]
MGAGTSAVGGVPSVQQVATSSVSMSTPPIMTTVMTAHVSGGYVAGAGGKVAGVAPGVGVSGSSLAGPAPGANVWPAAGVGALGAGVAPSSGIGLAGGAGAYGAGVPQAGLVEQHPGVGELTSMKLDISHKPPVMKGSFDLYSVQLRAFLTRLGCWDVVDGSYRLDPQGLISFAARDNAAREAILHGVPAADAEMICQELSAEAMWSRFVDRQTKREYSNYIFTRDEFVSNRYTPDKTIDQWLREMESLRRQLMHYGKQVSDEDFAETLLGHVSRTHRDVVRQFSKHYVVRDGGAVRPVPTAAQVMNALRAESALDERVACEEESKSARICSCGKQGRDDSQQSKKNKTKGKQQKGKGRYKSKQQNEGRKQVDKKEETRKCYECGEAGHLRANCPSLKSDSAVKPVISEFKRWENKKSNDDNSGKRSGKNTSAVCCHVRGVSVATAASVKTPAGTEMEWVLDSASDGHDGNAREDEYVSNVTLRVTDNKKPHTELKLPFTNVLLSPTTPDNLLSMDTLEREGWVVKFGFINSQRVCWLRKHHVGLLLLKTDRRYRLKATAVAVYTVQSGAQQVQQRTSDATSLAQGPKKKGDASSLERWHLRFAHLNLPALQRMARHEVTAGMDEELSEDMNSPCWACNAAKMTRMSYKKPVTRRATGPFQKLMSDMCYVGEVTYNGFEHFQLVQDEASRSDQGPELFNNKLKFFLEANGIEYTTTNAYSPEENGLVKKMNGVVMSRVRCLLTAANMPWSLWGEAFNFAIEVMNISGSSALGGETSYYRRFSERPDVSTLRTWGCVAFIFTPKVLRKSKLENPGKPGLFVGYAKHSESIRILNLLTGKINEVRSVEFEEEWTVEASYVEKLLSNRYGKGRHELPTIIPYVRLPVVHSVTRGLKRNSESDDNGQSKCLCCEHHANCGAATDARSGPTPPVASGAPGRWSVSEIEVPVASTAAAATPPTPEGVLQLGGNAPQFEDSYRESGDNGAADSPNSSRMQTAGPPLDRGVSRSVGDQDSYDAAGNEAADGNVEMDDANASFEDPADLLGRLTTYEGFIDHDSEEEDDDEADGWRHEASRAATSFRRSTRIRRPNVRLQDYEIEIPASLVIEAVNVLMEPQTVDETLQGPDAEKWLEALEKEYYDLMRNNAWVLVERPKGKKILGISHESVKLVLLLALHYGLPCEHVDFVTAFLNGPIGDDVEIYMEMPDYFNDGSGRVCRSKVDNGVYWRVVGGSPIFLTVYVDDVIIAANAENIKLVVSELERKFSIKDLGSVSLLLGMEIKYIPGQAMWISQRGQIEKILKRFQMDKCRAVATPQTLGPLPLPATLNDEDVNDPNVPYHAIVGCLQYLVHCTRPDLANAVRALGKYLNKYTHEKYTMAKRVLRYLQGSSDFGLVWEKKGSPDLHFVAYADADLGNEKDDRHSITGYVLQLNGCTYAYKSRKQRIVTDDTCCAEFVAASKCSTMIVWTHNLCKELNLTRYHPTVLCQDNQATITVLTEIKGNFKTKIVDLKYHKVCDFHERGEFEVRYCPSSENLADIFTKALGPTLFRKFRQRLNVMPLPTAIDNGNADGSN